MAAVTSEDSKITENAMIIGIPGKEQGTEARKRSQHSPSQSRLQGFQRALSWDVSAPVGLNAN